MKAPRTEISPAMQELSAYIASAIKKPLPPQIVERAKVHLVDTYAAMISGSRLVPGKRAVAYVKAQGGKPEAGVRAEVIEDYPDDKYSPSALLPGFTVAGRGSSDEPYPQR